jgi:hypothetical protein
VEEFVHLIPEKVKAKSVGFEGKRPGWSILKAISGERTFGSSMMMRVPARPMKEIVCRRSVLNVT